MNFMKYHYCHVNRVKYASYLSMSNVSCEPLQVQMSHCSLFELACVPAVPSVLASQLTVYTGVYLA